MPVLEKTSAVILNLTRVYHQCPVLPKNTMPVGVQPRTNISTTARSKSKLLNFCAKIKAGIHDFFSVFEL